MNKRIYKAFLFRITRDIVIAFAGTYGAYNLFMLNLKVSGYYACSGAAMEACQNSAFRQTVGGFFADLMLIGMVVFIGGMWLRCRWKESEQWVQMKQTSEDTLLRASQEDRTQ